MNTQFEIVDRQADFVVVNKPADINFHDEGDIGQGLFNQVKEQLVSQLDIQDLYPVHRLDKITSGLIIFATSKNAAQSFQQMFSDHQIQKYYLAISTHKPKKKQGLIKGDMEKSRRGMYKLLRTTNNPAITQFYSYGLGNGNRLFLLKPHSGKTHQLRVALNSLSAPILGDSLYSNQQDTKNIADRGYLHAYALSFSYKEQQYVYQLQPTEGQHFLDKTFVDKLQALGKVNTLDWPVI